MSLAVLAGTFSLAVSLKVNRHHIHDFPTLHIHNAPHTVLRIIKPLAPPSLLQVARGSSKKPYLWGTFLGVLMGLRVGIRININEVLTCTCTKIKFHPPPPPPPPGENLISKCPRDVHHVLNLPVASTVLVSTTIPLWLFLGLPLFFGSFSEMYKNSFSNQFHTQKPHLNFSQTVSYIIESMEPPRKGPSKKGTFLPQGHIRSTVQCTKK